MRSLLAISLAAVGASCRSAPAPVAVPLDDETAVAHHGALEEWSPWMGLDEWAAPGHIDWRGYLTGESTESGSLSRWASEDGCVFEVIQRDGRTLRRWYLLVRPDDEASGIEMGTAQMTLAEEDRTVEIPLFFHHALVTVAPEGREVAQAREALLPLISANLGYTITANETLKTAYDELDAAGALTEDAQDRYTSASMRPAIALLSLFQGVQEHPELSEILREVVDAPSILSIILAGGLKLSLEADLESAARCECPVGDAHFQPGVRFPASLNANGELALEMEIFATESVRPVHLTGGLVGLRAWLPGNESHSVELKLVGARISSAR